MASKKANGNVPPSRFVVLDTSNAGKAGACTAGGQIYGVSFEGVRRTPIDGFLSGIDDGYAAVSGENFRVYKNPEDRDCLLEMNSSCNIGDKIKSGTAGIGVVTTSGNDPIGAIAMEASSAQYCLIRVELLPPGTNL